MYWIKGRSATSARLGFSHTNRKTKAPSKAAAVTSTTAVETYLVLLERTGRAQQALDEYAKLVPADCPLSPYAPTLLRLAQASGGWQRYFEICQQRNDVVGFAAGQLSQQVP